MSAKTQFTTQQVHHIATLANLPVSPAEETAIASAFAETLDVIANLASVDTTGVEPTAQTTGLENVWREDVVNLETTLSQKEALANAEHTAQGYFVVDRILHHDE
jgi:aspartyl-tRNA(Asn)/glutamyl-tRNA(Gln) amidotransferase subunit C